MEFKKIPYQTGLQILSRFEPQSDCINQIDEETGVAQTIEVLQQKKAYSDLVQFFAHGLPVREAIWWAALTLQKRHSDWTPMQLQCIESAKQWVQKPSEETRRKLELFANKLNMNCGPSWLAQAVFWNGSGSIVAPDQPQVLPDPFLYAKAVAGAINHSAALPQWDQSESYLTASIGIAMEIAGGGNGQEAKS